MILRFMKSDWQYQDATNVIGYYGKPVVEASEIPPELEHFDESFFSGSAQSGEDVDSKYKIVVDPAMALHLLRTIEDPLRTLWVFRYYDLDERSFPFYGAGARAPDRLHPCARGEEGRGRAADGQHHRALDGRTDRPRGDPARLPERDERAEDHINKVVTLGTPHQGISFTLLKEWIKIDAAEELKHFDPEFQTDKNEDDRRSSASASTSRPSGC